jgi:hypothetical protein
MPESATLSRPRGPRCAGEDWVDVCEDHRRRQARGAPRCVAFTSAPVCPDCPDKSRPYACEGMLSAGQTTYPKTTRTSGTSGHVAEATWLILSRLHNPSGQQGQWSELVFHVLLTRARTVARHLEIPLTDRQHGLPYTCRRGHRDVGASARGRISLWRCWKKRL